MKKTILLLIFVLGLFFVNWRLFISSVVILDHGNITVERGDNFSTIEGDVLKGNSAFYPEFMYRVYRYVFPLKLKPGTHHFPVGATFSDVYHQLDREIAPVKVRLPEGDRASAYAAILEKEGVVEGEDLVDCFRGCSIAGFEEYKDGLTGFEGFLFPDTYLFNPGSQPEHITRALLQNFRSRTTPLVQEYSTFVQREGIRKVVIIASLLEREARTLEDKRMVAGILYKRLNIGMRLDVDATVLYIKGDWRSPITVQDLASDSPYNTRKFAGLPPGPIANPSLESIESAMSPIASSYLYYLNSSNGDTHYATTLEGHVQNKWKYL